MYKRWRVIWRWRVVATMAVLFVGTAPAAANNLAVDDSTSVRTGFEQMIQERVNFYNAAFPDIHFVHLRGGLGWSVDMQFLPLLLGQGAANLDYDHPAALRGDLLQASMRRLEIMLHGGHASASLFRKGARGLARRDNVCVVTLNPDALATSDLETTADMLDLPRKVIERMHPARYLDTEDHVAFAVDHEVFHCLDALYNGPMPRSHKPYAGNYAAFRNENGADAFAVAMNIHRHGTLTRYARNIMHVRALALVSDPDHCTWAIIQHVLELKPQTVAAASVQKLFEVAGSIRDMLTPDYERYVEFRIAAYEVRAQVDLEIASTPAAARGVAAERASSRSVVLARQTEFWFAQLFRDEPFAVLRHRVSTYW